jgi:ubiquinone biosynthesis protein Coq4
VARVMLVFSGVTASLRFLESKLPTTLARGVQTLRSCTALLRAVPIAAEIVFDPTRVDRVLSLASLAAQHPGAARMLSELRDNASLALRFGDRPRLGAVEMERLATLPAGTLGHEYADFMSARMLSP